MKTSILTLLISLLLALPISSALADIVASGDTLPVPSDTFWWSNGGDPTFPTYIGCNSVGSIAVDSGSSLATKFSYVGVSAGSLGVASVDGEGSTWAITDMLLLGDLGSGALNVTGGGSVSVGGNVIVGSMSQVSLLMNQLSPTLSIGGSLLNAGTVQSMVGPEAEAGTYTPVSVAGNWVGDGTFHAYGGVWDEATHALNISEASKVQTNASYTTVNIDLANAPRLDFPNIAVGRRAGVSFCQGEGTFDFKASTVHDLHGLASLLNTEQVMLAGLEFKADLPEESEAMISFEIGDGHDPTELHLWQYIDNGADINVWKAFQPDTLFYSHGWVHFTIDEFSGYAVSGASITEVPGDANRDGAVDGSDVTIIAGNWQAGVGNASFATWNMGDFNGDGTVDGSDVTILAGNWQYGVTTAAASVPEPSVVVLLLASIVGFVAMRNR